MSYISDYKVSGDYDEYKRNAAIENARERFYERVDTFQTCWTTGHYTGQDCGSCPYASECSGSEDE